MNTNFTNPNLEPGGDETEKPIQKKAYSTPQIRHFGSLTELTQLAPNRGGDGCTTWADCTFT